MFIPFKGRIFPYGHHSWQEQWKTTEAAASGCLNGRCGTGHSPTFRLFIRLSFPWLKLQWIPVERVTFRQKGQRSRSVRPIANRYFEYATPCCWYVLSWSAWETHQGSGISLREGRISWWPTPPQIFLLSSALRCHCNRHHHLHYTRSKMHNFTSAKRLYFHRR